MKDIETQEEFNSIYETLRGFDRWSTILEKTDHRHVFVKHLRGCINKIPSHRKMHFFRNYAKTL